MSRTSTAIAAECTVVEIVNFNDQSVHIRFFQIVKLLSCTLQSELKSLCQNRITKKNTSVVWDKGHAPSPLCQGTHCNPIGHAQVGSATGKIRFTLFHWSVSKGAYPLTEQLQ